MSSDRSSAFKKSKVLLTGGLVLGSALTTTAVPTLPISYADPTSPAPTSSTTSPTTSPTAPSTTTKNLKVSGSSSSIYSNPITNSLWVGKGDKTFTIDSGSGSLSLGVVTVTLDGNVVDTLNYASSTTATWTLKQDFPDGSQHTLVFSNDADAKTTLKFTSDTSGPVNVKGGFVGSYEIEDNETDVAPGAKLKVTNVDDSGSGFGFIQCIHQNYDGSGSSVVATVDRDTFNAQGGFSCPLDVEGVYYLKVFDNLANQSIFNLPDIGTGANNNSVVVKQKADTGTALIDATVNGNPVNGGWYLDTAKMHVTIADPGNLGATEVRVNGQRIVYDKIKYTADNKAYDIDLTSIASADGVYDVEIIAVGRFGVKSTKEVVVRLDKDNPVPQSATVVSQHQQDKDGTIFSKTPVTLSVNVLDSSSGVAKVELVSDSGTVPENCSTGTNVTCNFSVGSVQNAKLRVTDAVGHVAIKSLTDMGLSSNNIVIDGDSPVVKRTDSEKSVYTDPSGRQWYNHKPVFTWTVNDANLKVVSATVNGQDTGPLKYDSNGNYSVDTSKFSPLPGGLYQIKLHSVDKADNSTDDSVTIYTDLSAPTGLKATLGGSFQDRPYGVYSNTTLKITSSSNDGSGSGVAGYRLRDSNGSVVVDSKDGNITLPNGSFTITSYDNVGNESSPVTLQSLLGTKTNNFYVDNTAPTVSVSRPDPVYQSWYGGDVPFNIVFSDDTALNDYTINVNGKNLRTFTASSINKTLTESFNTSEVNANSDGSYNVVITAHDGAGNPVSWSQTLYVDRANPQITGFTFTDPGYKEGDSISRDSRYGFFFQNATGVDITATDAAPSSGIRGITYTLRDSGGAVVRTETVQVNGGVAHVTVPQDFKGYISAVATDYVNHTSTAEHPSGVVTESQNWHINTSAVSISVPDPGHRDNKGQNLYNGDTSAAVNISQSVAGVRQVQWGINGQVLGTINVDINGNLDSGGCTVSSRDQNLVTGMTCQFPISGNSNDMNLFVHVVDRAGQTSDQNTTVSIDKDAPVISVTYNQDNVNGFYNSNRVATVTIRERNFRPSDVQLTGEYGTLSGWVNVGNDTWQMTIVFSNEQKYQWGLSYTDMAGNAGNSYSSENFTVDKTAPAVTLTWDNNNVHNDKYYNSERTATITVVDANFDPSGVHYSGSGQLSGWSSNGSDTHAATVTFASDGDYQFNVSVTDQAGNTSNTLDSGAFTIDLDKPDVKVDGVENGVSYKKDFLLKNIINDAHLDLKSTTVEVTGRVNGKMDLAGSLGGNGGELDLNNLPMDKKYDDVYHVKIHAMDLAGNSQDKELDFSVNRFGSDFAFDSEDYNGKYYQSLPGDVSLTVTSVDRLDLSQFKLVVLKDGSPYDVPANMWSVTESGGKDGPWVYHVVVKKEAFTEDGVYRVQLFTVAQDGSKESSMQEEYTFVIDHTPPQVILSGIDNNKTYNEDGRTATIDVRDLSGVQDIKVQLNGKDVPVEFANGVYSIRVPANQGYHDMKVRVTDKAGNTTDTGVSNFFITTSQLEAWWHNPVVRAIVYALTVILLGLLALLLFLVGRRRKRDKDQESAAAEARAASSGDGVGATSTGIGEGTFAGSEAEVAALAANAGRKPTSTVYRPNSSSTSQVNPSSQGSKGSEPIEESGELPTQNMGLDSQGSESTTQFFDEGEGDTGFFGLNGPFKGE